ncbi:MAG: tripartite tricarboxylate transporter substrate binding protein [Pseudomonadota bacterium]|nr:tripartite tricarboxylate transporter substrate binding protein [Pseudomonadota bacterium]
MPFLARLATVLVASTLLATTVWADTYPSRPITMIVPYPPGGATDVIGRIVAQELTGRLGQQVIVDNKGGAGGNIGAKQAAQAKNDGYTILMGALTAHSIAQTLTPQTANYNLEKDFEPIALIGKVPVFLVISPKLAVKNVREFIALAKSKPGKLTVASAGIGTTQHLAAEQFMLATGTKLLHVPYKGCGPAMADLLGGQVDATFETGPAAMSFIKSGQLRALAFASNARTPLLPDLPTMSEAGVDGFEVSATYGLLAPAGTPAAIVARLSGELKAILAVPEVQARLAEQGVVTTYLAPEQTALHIHNEIAKWAKVIKAADVKPL